MYKYKIGKDTLLIKLIGRITSSNIHEIEEGLVKLVEENIGLELVIDAEDLRYISSAGLRTLLRIRRLKNRSFEIRNVPDEIYDIFAVTNFFDLFDVRKPIRNVYLDNNHQTFRGINGGIYLLDDETMVKVFKKGTPYSEVKQEREYSHRALVCGIPTLIPFDVVMVGDSYGVVFESAGCETMASAIKRHPEKLEEFAKSFAAFLHDIHSITINDEFPDVKERYRRWVEKAGRSLSARDRKDLDMLIGGVPDSNRYIHGYITPGNVIINRGEFMLIDMAGSAHGHPFFDIQGLNSALVEIEKDRPMYCSSTFGVSAENCSRFWDTFFRAYMAGRKESELSRMNGLLESSYEVKKRLLDKLEV